MPLIVYCIVPTIVPGFLACDEVGGDWGLWKSESSKFCICCLLLYCMFCIIFLGLYWDPLDNKGPS